MSKNKVEIVGINTNKLKNLEQEENINLIKEYQNGNKEIFSKIVEGNLKLVLSVVQKYTNRKENLDDLFQIGVLGLIKAINNFDLTKNVLFSTYAVPMINGEIKRYIRDNNSLKISRQLKDISYKALKVKEDYIEKNNKEPSIEELSKILNINEFDIKEAFDSSYKVLSIYEPVSNENGDELFLVDQISNNEFENDRLIDFITLKDALINLDDTYKKIIHKRYYEDLTQSEIARKLNMTQVMVSRYEKKGIEKMRQYMTM